MDEGEIGGPVEMFGNWWIFKLIDHRQPAPRSLARVRSQIESKLKQEREQKATRTWVEELKEKADYFIDLNPIREELGLGIASTETDSE
jgi:hypothetical protein